MLPLCLGFVRCLMKSERQEGSAELVRVQFRMHLGGDSDIRGRGRSTAPA